MWMIRNFHKILVLPLAWNSSLESNLQSADSPALKIPLPSGGLYIEGKEPNYSSSEKNKSCMMSRCCFGRSDYLHERSCWILSRSQWFHGELPIETPCHWPNLDPSKNRRNRTGGSGTAHIFQAWAASSQSTSQAGSLFLDRSQVVSDFHGDWLRLGCLFFGGQPPNLWSFSDWCFLHSKFIWLISFDGFSMESSMETWQGMRWSPSRWDGKWDGTLKKIGPGMAYSWVEPIWNISLQQQKGTVLVVWHESASVKWSAKTTKN